MPRPNLRATKSVTLVVAVVVERQSRYEVGTKGILGREAEKPGGWEGEKPGRGAGPQ